METDVAITIYSRVPIATPLLSAPSSFVSLSCYLRQHCITQSSEILHGVPRIVVSHSCLHPVVGLRPVYGAYNDRCGKEVQWTGAKLYWCTW